MHPTQLKTVQSQDPKSVTQPLVPEQWELQARPFATFRKTTNNLCIPIQSPPPMASIFLPTHSTTNTGHYRHIPRRTQSLLRIRHSQYPLHILNHPRFQTLLNSSFSPPPSPHNLTPSRTPKLPRGELANWPTQDRGDERRAAQTPAWNFVLTEVRVTGGGKHKEPVGPWVIYVLLHTQRAKTVLSGSIRWGAASSRRSLRARMIRPSTSRRPRRSEKDFVYRPVIPSFPATR